jgi:hypothetical protein
MARARSAHLAVVLDADEQVAKPFSGTVRETNDRFDESAVVQRAMLLPLELEVQRLAPGDQFEEPFRRHSGDRNTPDGVLP